MLSKSLKSTTAATLRGISRFSTSTILRSPQAPLDASKLKIEETASRKTYPAPEDLVFGKVFTDHMLTIEWTQNEGWGTPVIKPYQNLPLDPAASVLHYAFECFEGMKAFKNEKGSVTLFRPDMNMKRLNTSGKRIALPEFDAEQMIELLKKFVKLEQDIIPSRRGYSLYLRPAFIGTNAELGVKHPSKALLYVIASPVGPYYPGGFKAVSLQASEHAVRAWPGGVGNKKLGANYAPTIVPQDQAAEKGYEQVLWLFGEDEIVTEAGTMNAFFVFKDPSSGKKELVTCPLDGTILEGITRASILELGKERLDPNEWIVNERYFTMKEVEQKANEGNLVEAFGAGTAAVVSPIKAIGYKGKDIQIPLQEGKEAGPLAEQMANWVAEIQYGLVEHDWNYKV